MRRAVMFIMYTGLSAKCVGGQRFKAVSTDVMSAREAKNCNELVHLLITFSCALHRTEKQLCNIYLCLSSGALNM